MSIGDGKVTVQQSPSPTCLLCDRWTIGSSALLGFLTIFHPLFSHFAIVAAFGFLPDATRMHCLYRKVARGYSE